MNSTARWLAILILISATGCGSATGSQSDPSGGLTAGPAPPPAAGGLVPGSLSVDEAVRLDPGVPGRPGITVYGYLFREGAICHCPPNTPCSACPSPFYQFAAIPRASVTSGAPPTLLWVDLTSDGRAPPQLTFDDLYVMTGTLYREGEQDRLLSAATISRVQRR